MLNLRNELSSVKSQLKLTEEKSSSELKEAVNQLNDELQEQKVKNNVSVACKNVLDFYLIFLKTGIERKKLEGNGSFKCY